MYYYHCNVRPFSSVAEIDGKPYFCTNNTKDCYKQMMANPKTEICGMGKVLSIFWRIDGIIGSVSVFRWVYIGFADSGLCLSGVDCEDGTGGDDERIAEFCSRCDQIGWLLNGKMRR